MLLSGVEILTVDVALRILQIDAELLLAKAVVEGAGAGIAADNKHGHSNYVLVVTYNGV